MSVPLCPHGLIIGALPPLVRGEARGWELFGMPEVILEFYSACDCCDTLMHQSCAGTRPSPGTGYLLMKTGETLCVVCVGNRKDFLKI